MRRTVCKSKSTIRASLLPSLDLEFKWRGPVEVLPVNSKVIIKAPRKRNLDQTALDVIAKYVDRLMFPSKHFIDQKVKKALEYFVMRQMIMKLDNEMYPESHSLLNLFYDKIPVSSIHASTTDDGFFKYVYKLEEISKRGLLEVLLTIYWEFQERIQHDVPHDSIRKETLDVFDFIVSIAAKKPRDIVDMVFKGKLVNLGVILVDAWSERFIEYYRRRIQCQSKGEIEMIFILGAGYHNRQAAILVTEDFVRRNQDQWKMMIPVETEIISPKGRRIKSICILIKKMQPP